MNVVTLSQMAEGDRQMIKQIQFQVGSRSM